MLAGCGSTLVDHDGGGLIAPLNPCQAGYHQCGGECVLQDVSSCTSDCQPCAARANARTSCNAGTCEYVCETGFHPCNGECVPEDATSCGAGCAPCATLAGSTASCVAGQCAYACDLEGAAGVPGHVCAGGVCVPEDASSCGPGCAACPAPPDNAIATCTDHLCGIACNPGFLRCGNACCTASAIAAGGAHTCAIAEPTKSVVCWGADDKGQLGDGNASTADRSSPATAPLPQDVTAVAVSAGALHTCAVGSDGAAYCWGDNAQQQLGVPVTGPLHDPAPVLGLASGVKSVAAGGDHTCALMTAGTVKCWGANDRGQVGTGQATPSPVAAATDVVSLSSVTAIAAGGSHTCALRSNGEVWCWGANASGQVGNASTGDAAAPVRVALRTAASLVAAGNAHTLAAHPAAGAEPKATADADVWGSNEFGQLGKRVTVGVQPNPTPAANQDLGFAMTELTAGGKHSCAVGAVEPFKCWGNDDFGQLGARVPVDPETNLPAIGVPVHPQLPAPATSALHVSAGGEHTCAIASTGAVACWGRNDRGQVGTGTTLPAPNEPNPVFVTER